MVVALLRGKSRVCSISDQQTFLIEYAYTHGIAIEMTEIDDDLPSLELEKRTHLLDLIHKLEPGDTILVYDLWVLSKKVGELAKIFNCALKNDTHIHICKRNIVIDRSIPLEYMMELLSTQREENRKGPRKAIGRPKGSFSRSKFDPYKSEIVKMLEENLSVSEIAKRLQVSRSSLKDYINSRSLKEIVESQKMGKTGYIPTHEPILQEAQRNCPLKTDNKKISHKG